MTLGLTVVETNYLVDKLDVESAVKELDTQVKANAEDLVAHKEDYASQYPAKNIIKKW